MTPNELQHELSQFTCSETLYRYNVLFRGVLLTEGTHFLANEAGAFWLIDMLSSHLPSVPKDEHFVIAWLQKYSDEDGKDQALFQLMGDLDEDAPIDLYATQSIQYTDFPLDEIKLYAVRQESDWVIMLPSEY